MRYFLLPVAALLAVAVPASAQDAGTSVYKRTVKSVVWVHSARSNGLATGSGTLIDRDRRLVLTNYHVVEDVTAAKAFFPAFRDGAIIPERTYYRARAQQFAVAGRVVARDKAADLAIIQLDRLTDDVPAVPVATKSPEPGEAVHSIGNAGKSDALWGYVPGRVRQVYRKKWAAKLDDGHTLRFEARVVETDSATNPGDSGGPLVNDRGELVGVTQGKAVNADLVSTFVDVSEVRRFLAAEGFDKKADAKPAAAKPAREKALPIADGAKMFAADAVKKAQEQIDGLFKEHKLDVLVETHATVPPADVAKVKAMTNAERTNYMREWATARAKAEAANGFVILVCNDPRKFFVLMMEDTAKQFPAKFEGKLIDALQTGLKDKKPDEGLANVLKLIAENRGKK